MMIRNMKQLNEMMKVEAAIGNNENRILAGSTSNVQDHYVVSGIALMADGKFVAILGDAYGTVAEIDWAMSGEDQMVAIGNYGYMFDQSIRNNSDNEHDFMLNWAERFNQYNQEGFEWTATAQCIAVMALGDDSPTQVQSGYKSSVQKWTEFINTGRKDHVREKCILALL